MKNTTENRSSQTNSSTKSNPSTKTDSSPKSDSSSQFNLTQGPITRGLLRFCLPMLIGNLFQQLYNMVDTIVVGNFVGEKALAAVGSTGTIMFLLFALSSGLVSGFAILTSQQFGAGSQDGVRRSIANGILLSLILAAIVTIASRLAVRPLLSLMQTPEDIYTDAQTYLTIICTGVTASIFYNLFASFLRAVGNSRVPLYLLIISSAMNIALDLLFVVRFQMGVAGVGRATILSQALSALLCLIYVLYKVPELVPRKNEWRLYKFESAHQLRMGIPMGLQFGVTASGTMVMQAAYNTFGSTAVAAITAAQKLSELIVQGIYAMGVAMATFCGQNYGAKAFDRVRRGARNAMLIMVVYSIFGLIVMFTLLPAALKLFFSSDTDTAALMTWAAPYAHRLALFYIPLATILVCRNTMQGCDHAFLPLCCGVMELGARCVVAAAAIALHSYTIVCFSDPIAWLAGGIFAFIAMLFVLKHLGKA